MDEFSFFNAAWEDIDEIVAQPPRRHRRARTRTRNYPWGWAQAGNSPLRWYKQNTYGGGVRDPLVVHWPNGIADRGAIRTQFCHAVDITPDDPRRHRRAGARAPQRRAADPDARRVDRRRRSTTPTAPAPRSVQYFEQMGHRGLWADGWKITTYHEQGQPFDDDEWGLYHLDDDFSECHDLAGRAPREAARADRRRGGSRPASTACCRSTTAPSSCSAAPPRPGTVHARQDYVVLPADRAHPRRRVAAARRPRRGRSPPTSTCPTTASRACCTPAAATTSATSFFVHGRRAALRLQRARHPPPRARRRCALTPGPPRS